MKNVLEKMLNTKFNDCFPHYRRVIYLMSMVVHLTEAYTYHYGANIGGQKIVQQNFEKKNQVFHMEPECIA